MTKQEFLAMSLPYGLKCKDSDLLEPNKIYKYIGTFYQVDNETGYEKVKPILHPLTDLTKEIEHNGEKFTPYIELLRMSYFNVDDMTQDELNDYKDAYSSNVDPMLIPFLDGLKLIEWHFDLFNGIESGEAIDVNTLDENPYK